jgi:pimeloyl-ACP methyl ester carboxylesterase
MRTLNRRRALAMLGAGVALTPLSLRAARASTESELGFALMPAGRISGTLTIPDGKPPFPVVLIIAGSGPTDRDGNSRLGVKTDTYKLLAASLAARGIAALRYDKRAIGASTSTLQESDLRFEMYANDAITYIDMLAADPRFDRRFIAGHSEGSLLGILAAQGVAGRASSVAGFISLCGLGRPAYAVIHDQLQPQFSTAELARADEIMSRLTKGETVAEIPASPAFAALFHSSIQPYLSSWFKYDPAVEIAKLACPTAIVEGTQDVQVPVSEARALFFAAVSSKLTIVEGMSHTLKHVDVAAGLTQQRAYTDPSLPIEPAVIEAISTLIARPR